MLINALCGYYDILSDMGRLVPDGWTEQAVTRLVVLRADGSLADIIPYVDRKSLPQKNGKPKPVEVPRRLLLPYRAQTTKIAAYPLDHRSDYIFGLEWSKDGGFCTTDKSLAKHRVFVELNLALTEGMTSAGVSAFRNFLLSWKPEEHFDDPKLLQYGKGLFGMGTASAFALEGLAEKPLGYDNAEIRAMAGAAGSEQTAEGAVTGSCSVTGESGVPIPPLHDYIKGIRGTNATGGKLICFNNPCDESYGKTQSYNSSISAAAAKKYAAALNYLTASPYHRAYIDEMTIVYWAMSGSKASEDVLCDFFGSVLGRPSEGADVDNALADAMKKAQSGLTSAELEKLDIDPSVTFYAAGFTPNMSRISMKFFCRSSTIRLLQNIAQHQRDLAHDGLKEQPSIRQLAAACLSQRKKPAGKNQANSLNSENDEDKEEQSKTTDKKPSNPLYAALFSSVFNGTRYPRALLETVVRRCKTDGGRISDIRAAIIKACLNRAARLSDKKEVISMALDTQNTSPAYLCGRLFALLEKAQADAINNPNRTIKDSYFSSAATKPSAVFPRLIMLAQHHLEKAKSGGYLNGIISEVIGGLEGSFPTTLTTDQQGEFIIGYYQQNKALYTKKDENNDRKDN